MLYSLGVPVERLFGSRKFAVRTQSFRMVKRILTSFSNRQSFAALSLLVATVIEFAALLILHRVTGLNVIPPGPTALLFAIAYQYARLIPPAYHLRIFGVPLTNKAFIFAPAAEVSTTFTSCLLIRS
jgi:hypothetical protein